jgi:glutamate-ammonia-ligase adenylyltransferase
MIPLAPPFEELLQQVPFSHRTRARQRLAYFTARPEDALALAHLIDPLRETLLGAPDPDAGLLNLERFAQRRGGQRELYQLLAQRPALLASFIQVVSSSTYLADVLVRNPEYLDVLGEMVHQTGQRTVAQLTAELAGVCEALQSTESRLNAVRRFRRRELLRIGSADLRNQWDVVQVTRELSHLADAVVQQCLAIVADQPSCDRLAVVGLGKLGGDELNYSSDIDLLFVAQTRHDVELATRAGIALTQALSEVSEEGFLYRVDLRLRPYGASGALVVYPEMLERYMQREAHPAERQAMLKARHLAGAEETSQRLLERIGPLLYADGLTARRHVRQLKDRIERNLGRQRAIGPNVKLDPGGIRDIEFIVQSLQLEAGAGALPPPWGHTLTALAALSARGFLDERDAESLHRAYCFLRTVEHRLQLMNNQQVHHLPREAHALLVLARSLGMRGADAADQLQERYLRETRQVREVFQRILPSVDEVQHDGA